MTQFFSLSAPREKINHFDLKSWVTSGTKIWPKKLSHWGNKKMTQPFRSKLLNFSLSAPREKIKSFWPYNLSHWLNYNSTNFHKRSTEPLNYRIYARPQSIKQSIKTARRPEFYKYIDTINIIGIFKKKSNDELNFFMHKI